MEEKRKLKLIFYTFGLLLIIGIVGYMILLNISFIDALYMTVITISTVGFGEVAQMDAEAKIFSIFMIFWGVGIVGYAFTTVVVMFVEGRIIDIWKGRRMDNKIAQLSDHYIICGSGELSDVIVRKFIKEGLNFVVITDDHEVLENYSKEDILVVEGSSTEEEVLEKAQITKAKGLISTLDAEVDNIVTVLTARNLNDKIYIIANSITTSGSEKLMKVGADKTLSAVEISGKRMAALMIKPNIMTFLDVFTKVGSVELDLEEVTVMERSYLENKTILEAQIPKKTGLMILAIKSIESDELIFNPPIEYRFNVGDVLIVLGREEQVDKLRHLGDVFIE